MDLEGYAAPFPDFSTESRAALGTVTANLSVTGTQVIATGITGLTGYSGTITGKLVGADGMILVFELHDSSGNVVWGSAAMDNPTCTGCWDY